ncbi:MAG: hypothetical protein KTR14_00580 [Vampirovibrio sp.]|nr:hypothetical protein [Vampirovibrio sp.]
MPPKAISSFNGSHLFDQLQLSARHSPLPQPSWQSLASLAPRPIKAAGLFSQLKPTVAETGESLTNRIAMYKEVEKRLDRTTQTQLKQILDNGILTQYAHEDNHSTLYHLYRIAVTQRASGLDSPKILQESISLLADPFSITQKYDALTPDNARRMLEARNNSTQYINHGNAQAPKTPLSLADIMIRNSSNCVPSSLLYKMASQQPAELTRQLEGLTSPTRGFDRTVALSTILPDTPEMATQLLDSFQVPYRRSADPSKVIVRVETPLAGHIRAINDAAAPDGRRGITAAYQAAGMTLVTKGNYDPAKDGWANEDPVVVGLTADEKDALETIMTGKPVASVTYQVVAPKQNAGAAEENLGFLYGYSRTFDKMIQDITTAVNSLKHPVIVGYTTTDAGGAIVGAHEITITGVTQDANGEVVFEVADSDDGKSGMVHRYAREIIPRIHHVGFPQQLADNIFKEMEATPGYFVPDGQDKASFNTISLLRAPFPADGFLPTPNPQANTPQVAQLPTQPFQPSQLAPVIPPQPPPKAFQTPAPPFQNPYPQASGFQPINKPAYQKV